MRFIIAEKSFYRVHFSFRLSFFFIITRFIVKLQAYSNQSSKSINSTSPLCAVKISCLLNAQTAKFGVVYFLFIRIPL